MTTSLDVGLLQATDQEQLAFAIAQSRAIVTQDTDFLRFAETGQATSGIVFSSGQRRNIGPVIRGLLLIWEIYEPEEMSDRVEFL